MLRGYSGVGDSRSGRGEPGNGSFSAETGSLRPYALIRASRDGVECVDRQNSFLDGSELEHVGTQRYHRCCRAVSAPIPSLSAGRSGAGAQGYPTMRALVGPYKGELTKKRLLS